LTQEEYDRLKVDGDLARETAEKTTALSVARTLILKTAGKKMEIKKRVTAMTARVPQ
jgi:hypothetical protein